MLEIVSSDTDKLILEKIGLKKENILVMPLLLNIGDLSFLNQYERPILKEVLGIQDVNFKEKIDQIHSEKEIRVWSNHYNIEDYLLLLYICSIFDGRLFVVFSDLTHGTSYSLGSLPKYAYDKLIDLTYEIPLIEKLDYKDEWQKIVNANSDLRVLNNKKVLSVSFDSFNGDILTILKREGEIPVARFIGILMTLNLVGYTCDLVYLYLIKRLISQGKIKALHQENSIWKWIIKAS